MRNRTIPRNSREELHNAELGVLGPHVRGFTGITGQVRALRFSAPPVWTAIQGRRGFTRVSGLLLLLILLPVFWEVGQWLAWAADWVAGKL